MEVYPTEGKTFCFFFFLILSLDQGVWISEAVSFEFYLKYI